MDSLVDLQADVRVSQWFLMSSPLPTLVVVAVYLMVATLGPRVMRNFHSLDLKSAMIFYNLSLVLLSAYILYEFLMSTWRNPKFELLCLQFDSSTQDLPMRLLGACWWFYFSKLIELIDTVFFVLRKKTNQITFLHVYHHATMPLLWWLGVKYAGGGEVYFPPSFNSGVHVLMYLYYLLAALGPALRPYLWWKRYLTSLQLVQFCLVILKIIASMCVGCGYPPIFQYVTISYMTSHIVLFTKFYYQTYKMPANDLRVGETPARSKDD
ncbi:elongation of very long chain fatty acids protein 7-like [Physella acuta]|uniref:elongation of very long chain fatty acids protein 7-like n=1 Tax=Physella acuta TaxID=109671 RepID=UPI0027DCAF69|nr:elongation of very long chain fatty acids protein 7-like [Physella acuta]XP_059156420.1 elongation of very long chain fatty acids protein 7-like [Physella acuta]XP_059156421.1 elongation of very long chain fatty acids protein 7-like [Physella acuta]XP_059156422.1 elongation of very long chain fatty acids protein 7-like [Physella acuta]